MRLMNKKAIVTGAGQGIGHAIALKLAQEGADVVVAERNSETGTQTAKEIETIDRKAMAFPVDVADPKQVKEMVSRGHKPMGPNRYPCQQCWL